MQQGIEPISGQRNRDRLRQVNVVALMDQAIPILADFMHLVPGRRSDRTTLSDTRSPIHKVNRADSVVCDSSEFTAIRTECRFKLRPLPDQVGRFDIFNGLNEVTR